MTKNQIVAAKAAFRAASSAHKVTAVSDVAHAAAYEAALAALGKGGASASTKVLAGGVAAMAGAAVVFGGHVLAVVDGAAYEAALAVVAKAVVLDAAASAFAEAL